MVNGKIQAFPWDHWKNEFKQANACGFKVMEWTLDHEKLYENPLMFESGRREIKGLMKRFGVGIPSLTGDCFMQSPFYKATDEVRATLLKDLKNIVLSCAELNISNILIPLVDHGTLENDAHEESLRDGLNEILPVLRKANITITFESDFPPDRLKKFIEQFDVEHFGITYDIGNSASLGYDPGEEINRYFERIVNVHIKDRLLNGTTVPLGQGNADIPLVLETLIRKGYSGYYMLQTARADQEDHQSVLCRYRDFVYNTIKFFMTEDETGSGE